MPVNIGAISKTRFHVTICLWFCLTLFTSTVALPQKALAAVSGPFINGVAGFSAALPEGWQLKTYSNGLELTRDPALLSIENLGTSEGEVADILALFTQPDAAGSALTLSDTSSISTPYPGTRSSMHGDGYSADIAILKTPAGFFLISLEQELVDPGNQQAYEDLLKSFALLGTPPFDASLNQLQPVTIGPIDLAVPEGDLRVGSNSLLWKSTAAGILTAEMIKLGREQTLKGLLGEWESGLLSAETGLAAHTATLALHVEDRDALQADYSGDRIQARVQVSAIDRQQALVLALIARKETFASQQPVLDAVSFSVVAAGTPAPLTTKALTVGPASQKAHPEIVMAVSERTLLTPDTVNRLYQQKPTLFDNIRKTIDAIHDLDKTAADDLDTLTRAFRWQEQTANNPRLQEFHGALRSYKVSLSLLSKQVSPPTLPGSLARTYHALRQQGQPPLLAYDESLAQQAGFAGRDELYTQMLKAKGQTGKDAAAELSRYLQGKADLFWRNRLEAAHQHALLKENRQSIIEQLWQQQSRDLATISSQAAQ